MLGRKQRPPIDIDIVLGADRFPVFVRGPNQDELLLDEKLYPETR